MSTSIDGPNGQALWEKMDRMIPGGGIYMTRSARFAGRDVVPGFVSSAQGCRIEDADGKSYIDFNCGNGTNLLGYRQPEVDEAAAMQAQKMDLASFFPETMPAYAERLLRWGRGFDWTVLTKNGSDSTGLALRIMRAATGRPFIVLFNSAYHGFGVEIALAPETSLDEQQKYIIRVPWNDTEALTAVADKYKEQIAGILINPLDQSPSTETVELNTEMVKTINTVRANLGCYVAMDDVRNGFRIHPKGSHIGIGIEPDLLCLGKGVANGYSTSAVLGKEALRSAAAKIGFTATYMFSAVAFAAGIKTLDIYERDNVFDHLQDMGRLLRDGIIQAGKEAGHEDAIMSGPPTMPTFLFGNDVKAKRARVFSGHAARLGAIFHPRLNWFVSFAHQPSDIEEAIEIAQRAFRLTPRDVTRVA